MWLNKRMPGLIVLAVVLVAGTIWYINSSHNYKAVNNTEAFEIQVKPVIAEAEKNLQKTPQEALVITNDISGRQHVAIVFDGLPERKVLQQILESLKKHNAKAVFFVEGQNALEQPEMVELILNAGHKLGNYTFMGITEFEKLPAEKMLADICRAQQAISKAAATKPELFRAGRTVYTPQLLNSLNAAGVMYAVKSNANLTHGLLHNQSEADNMAKGIMPGSIIAVQLGVNVEQKVQSLGKSDERPAIDKKPTVELAGNVIAKQDNISMAQQVEWLLSSLEDKGFAIDFVDEFRKIRYAPENKPVK